MSSRRRKNEEAVERKLARILITQNISVSVAESCTGGLVAASLVNAEGISSVFGESYVTYSDQAKMKLLGVKEETLNRYGAVSRETAAEMAEGAAKAAGTDLAAATTGIAGPDGGTPEKPVGLVYIGCYYRGKTIVKRCFYGGDRQGIRYAAAKEAIEILYCQVLTSALEKRKDQ